MASAGKLLPPPDLRFDTSDTSGAPPARVPVAPIVVVAATEGDRSRPIVVKIPPKVMPRGSESEMDGPAMNESDVEGAGSSLASGSVPSAAPPVPEPPAPPVSEPLAPLVVATRAANDTVAAKRGIERIKMPRVSKRYVAVAAPDTSRPSGTSRRLVIGSAAVAGTCIAVAMGAILWARSSVTKSESVLPRQAGAPSVPSVVQTEAPRPPVTAPVVVPDVAVVAPDVAVVAPDVAVVAPDVAVVAPGAAAPQTCRLEIRADVQGSTVWVDGKRVGAAPAAISAACSAVANVEVRHPRYLAFAEAVTLDPAAAGGVTTRMVVMEREKTALTLSSEPAGAQVTYNGSVVGKTPLVIKVNRYEQGTVWFRAPNHEPDWRKIVPSKATKTVSIKLKGMILRPPS